MCALVHVPPIIISKYPPKNTEKGFYILSTSLLISRKPNSQAIKKEQTLFWNNLFYVEGLFHFYSFLRTHLKEKDSYYCHCLFHWNCLLSTGLQFSQDTL